MASIVTLIGGLEKNKAFSEWKDKNKKVYLSSVFVMVKETASLSEESWQGNEWLLSYYDPEDDTFTTFSSSGEQRASKEQAFKKEKALARLEKDAVKIEIWDAIKSAEEVRKDKYKEEAGSVIAILQPLGDEEIGITAAAKGKPATRLVWNITYITKAYKVLNIKIDATTGKVLTDSSSGVMDFVQQDKEDA